MLEFLSQVERGVDLSSSNAKALNWKLSFKVMCDASDYAIGEALGQRKDNKPYAIYSAS